MNNLYNETKYIMNKYGISANKSLGQNFLVNENAVENASRLTATLKNDALCLEGMTDWFLEEMNEDMSFECEKILGAPPAIANRALIALYGEVSEGRTLEATHIAAIRQLCAAAVPHSTVNLPANVDAKIENGRLYFEKRRPAPAIPEDYEIKLCEGVNTISAVHAQIIIGNSQNPINIYKKSIMLYFDSDKIFGGLTARNRRAGDKIRVRGVNRSVKKLMCDKKIPLELRYRLPVICDEHGIVAVPMCEVRDGAALADNKADADSLRVRIDIF